MRLSGSTTTLRPREGGAIAIEFAVVATLFVSLALGIVDVGRAFYAYDILAKSVRAAARHVATGKLDDAQRLAQARCIVLTGSPVLSGSACSGTPQLPDLSESTVTITILTPANTQGVNDVLTGVGTIDLVTVSVSGYPMSKITALLFPDLVLGSISSTMPNVNF